VCQVFSEARFHTSLCFLDLQLREIDRTRWLPVFAWVSPKMGAAQVFLRQTYKERKIAFSALDILPAILKIPTLAGLISQFLQKILVEFQAVSFPFFLALN